MYTKTNNVTRLSPQCDGNAPTGLPFPALQVYRPGLASRKASAERWSLNKLIIHALQMYLTRVPLICGNILQILCTAIAGELQGPWPFIIFFLI
jgi:hypothetical protein